MNPVYKEINIPITSKTKKVSRYVVRNRMLMVITGSVEIFMILRIVFITGVFPIDLFHVFDTSV